MIVTVLCALPFAAGTAVAQDRGAEKKVQVAESGLEIVEVRIYARDIASGEDLAWVNPGDTLVLPMRSEVRLRMEALPRAKGPRYPSASYAVTESRPVAGIERANPEMGSATLQTYGRPGTSTLHYTILDTSIRLGDLRQGHVDVRVEEGTEVASPAAPVSDDSLIEALYRGILLRDPEAAAIESGLERLQQGGYQEAITIANQIAASEESTEAVFERATPEERLEALYRHLLGVERDDVDAQRWNSDMRWVRTGNVLQVVSAMVQSETFQERFGFDERTGLRRRAAATRN